MGLISNVSLSNSLRSRGVTWSHTGGIFRSSTRPGSFGSDSESLSDSSLELYSDSESSEPSGFRGPRRSTRTFFFVRSGGCDRERFSQSRSIRTATRNDVRPYRWCVCGVHEIHTEGSGGFVSFGTKNSKPSRPCNKSGWSKNNVETFLITWRNRREGRTREGGSRGGVEGGGVEEGRR